MKQWKTSRYKPKLDTKSKKEKIAERRFFLICLRLATFDYRLIAMYFHIVTLFPEMFESYIKTSIIGRAIKDKKIKIKFYNPRDFTKDKHRRVDQKPYGGGPGMVLEPDSVVKAVAKAVGTKKNIKVIFFAANGKQFTGKDASGFSKRYDHVVMICGHYEGIDERVKKIFKATSVSVGPYVLTGGELPALIVLDAVARHIPDVLGNIDSLEEGRAPSSEVYTRPEVLIYKGKQYRVPKVLLSGHHKNIEAWKRRKRGPSRN